MNVTGPHWWIVNIGSGKGLVPSGDKPLPEPVLTRIQATVTSRPFQMNPSKIWHKFMCTYIQVAEIHIPCFHHEDCTSKKKQYFERTYNAFLMCTHAPRYYEFTMILYPLLPLSPDPPDKLKYVKCTVYWVVEICISNTCSFCTHDTNGQSLDSLQ